MHYYIQLIGHFLRFFVFVFEIRLQANIFSYHSQSSGIKKSQKHDRRQVAHCQVLHITKVLFFLLLFYLFIRTFLSLN